MATGPAQGVYNVWIVGSNTVYRGVPFTVVCDWIQEGRLLPKDCVRTPTEANWHYLNEMPLFAPYFPSADTTARPDDAAEAYEPIEMEFQPRSRGEEGDDDPDMIPLIDVSMVLLVFFMMTSSALLAESPGVDVPEAKIAYAAEKQGALYITALYSKSKEYHYRIGAPAENSSSDEKKKWALGVPEAQLWNDIPRGIEQVKKKSKGGEIKKIIITADKEVPFADIQTKLQIPFETGEKLGFALKVEFKVNFNPSGLEVPGGGAP